MRTVQFLILNFANAHLVDKLVQHIEALEVTFPFGFTIVDNFSSEDEVDLIRNISEKHGASLILSDSNTGYACGNNIGLRAIESLNPEALVFVCNSDIYFPDSAVLNQLYRQLVRGGSDFVSAAMEVDGLVEADIYKINSLAEDCVSLLPGFMKKWTGRKAASTGRAEANSSTSSGWSDAEYLNGSFFGGSITSFRKAGFFDERTFLYCEERMFGRRCMKAGLKMQVYRAGTYMHLVGVSTKAAFREYRRMVLLCDSRMIFYQFYEKGLRSVAGRLIHGGFRFIFNILAWFH